MRVIVRKFPFTFDKTNIPTFAGRKILFPKLTQPTMKFVNFQVNLNRNYAFTIRDFMSIEYIFVVNVGVFPKDYAYKLSPKQKEPP